MNAHQAQERARVIAARDHYYANRPKRAARRLALGHRIAMFTAATLRPFVPTRPERRSV